jgi:hypothetical protein
MRAPSTSDRTVAERKSFLLRIDPELHAALEKWAADELRSLNGQIEYLLTEALNRAGRLRRRTRRKAEEGGN